MHATSQNLQTFLVTPGGTDAYLVEVTSLPQDRVKITIRIVSSNIDSACLNCFIGIGGHGDLLVTHSTLDSKSSTSRSRVYLDKRPGVWLVETDGESKKLLLHIDAAGLAEVVDYPAAAVHAGFGAQLLCFEAAWERKPKSIERLLALGVNPAGELSRPLERVRDWGDPTYWATKDRIGWTALHYSVLSPCEGTLERLIAAVASPDLPDSGGSTPLHVAARLKLPDACFRLLTAGADLQRKNIKLQTPLDCAQADPETLAVLRRWLILGRRNKITGSL